MDEIEEQESKPLYSYFEKIKNGITSAIKSSIMSKQKEEETKKEKQIQKKPSIVDHDSGGSGKTPSLPESKTDAVVETNIKIEHHPTPKAYKLFSPNPFYPGQALPIVITPEEQSQISQLKITTPPPISSPYNSNFGSPGSVISALSHARRGSALSIVSPQLPPLVLNKAHSDPYAFPETISHHNSYRNIQMQLNDSMRSDVQTLQSLNLQPLKEDPVSFCMLLHALFSLNFDR